MNYSDLKMSSGCLKSPVKHLLTGPTPAKLNLLEPREIKEDILNLKSSPLLNINKQIIENQFAIVECQEDRKKKILKDKLNSLKNNIQITKLSKILDQALISKEKDLTPFWNEQSKERSKKFWLPTKIDSVVSVLNSSNTSLKPPMGESWFSIKKQLPPRKNSLMTSFQLSQCSLPDSMDLEVTPSRKKSGKAVTPKMKTLKIRMFPTEDQKDQINLYFEQFKWYYNASLSIFNKENLNGSIQFSKFRDIVKQYEYTETELNDNLILMDYIKTNKTNKNKFMCPNWWNEIHQRVPRGAIFKLTTNIHSATSNKKNGNIKHFNIDFMRSKDSSKYLHFEDSSFPSMFRDIKSNYWYRTKDRKRKVISFKDIFNKTKKRGLEVICEKETDRYFIHYPVDVSWFPSDDLRIDNQDKYTMKVQRIISLDPGIRKFLVGYDPTGTIVKIADGENYKLSKLLKKADEDKKYFLKVKNYVNELHWKVISFLVENYDVILLPDFRTQQMLRGNKLDKSTKRLMNIYSFYKFKERLKYKCNVYNKQLIIVDESYTSCTCTNCGKIKKLGGCEIYTCSNCNLTIDRDVNGSRNIFIKNILVR